GRAEDPDTTRLVRALTRARRRGWLTRAEFLAACRWKSARAVRRQRVNGEARIRAVTRAAFATSSERRRMALLTELAGVSVRTASAILTLTAPRRYGVLDIRVWQLLYRLAAVRRNPAGRSFTLGHWLEFVGLLRRSARRYGVGARALEIALFRCHRRLQTGRLYE
ncbi:MAG: hypothetical protein ACRELS_10115, partial [Candidatus Rokuibacteriota bacterium]